MNNEEKTISNYGEKIVIIVMIVVVVGMAMYLTPPNFLDDVWYQRDYACENASAHAYADQYGLRADQPDWVKICGEPIITGIESILPFCGGTIILFCVMALLLSKYGIMDITRSKK
jgi:hypothetical protein